MATERWHIVSQHQTTDLAPNGQFQDVMEVTGQSDDTGVHATVRVPLAAYNAENVERLMDQRFAVVHAVHALGQGS